MRKFIIGSYCFVLLCVLISVIAIPMLNKSSTASNTETEIPNNSLSYIVKDFNGNIAVFEENSDKPFKVTEVCTNTLPKIDQERLMDGIIVNSQLELNTLLEDLCS